MKQVLLVFLLNGGRHMVVTTSRDEAKRVIASLASANAPDILGSHNVKTSDPEFWYLQSREVYLAHTAEYQGPLVKGPGWSNQVSG